MKAARVEIVIPVLHRVEQRDEEILVRAQPHCRFLDPDNIPGPGTKLLIDEKLVERKALAQMLSKNYGDKWRTIRDQTRAFWLSRADAIRKHLRLEE